MPTKVHVVGRDIFDNTRYEMIVPSSQIVQVPIITKKIYTFIDVSKDKYITMMDDNSNIREDLQIDEEMYNKIIKIMDNNEIKLTCLGAVGTEKIIEYKIF